MASDQSKSVDMATRFAQWAARHRWWIFGAIAVLYMAGFNGQWRMGGDSAIYLNAARHLIAPADYPPAELPTHRMPGVTWLFAGAMSIAGPTHAVTIVCAVMLLINFAILALTYRLVRVLLNQGVAVIVTVLVAVNAEFVQAGYEILTDTPFLLGVMLFLVGFVERTQSARYETPAKANIWITALMMVCGLAIMLLTKRTAWVFIAALVLSIVIGFVARRGKFRRTLIAGTVVAAIGAAAYLSIVAFGSPQMKRLFMAHIFEKFGVVETLSLYAKNFIILFEKVQGDGPVTLFGVFSIELFIGLNTLVSLMVLAFGIGTGRLNRLLGCYVLCSVAAFVLHTPGARYFIALLPVLALGWWRAVSWAHVRLPAHLRGTAFALLLFLWLTPNLVRAAVLIVEQRRTPFIEHYEDGEMKPLIELADVVREKVGVNELVISPHHSLVTYFSGRQSMSDRMLNRRRDFDQTYLEKLRANHKRFYILVEIDDSSRPKISEKMRKRIFDDPYWLNLELIDPPIAVSHGARDYALYDTKRKAGQKVLE